MAKENAQHPRFSVKEALSLGFDLTKKNLFYFVCLFIIVAVIYILVSILRTTVTFDKGAFEFFIVTIVALLIELVIGMGVTKIALDVLDNKKPKLTEVFYYKPIVNYILATIIESVIVVLGFILLIIPGIVFAIKLQFVPYLVIDKNMEPIEAIKKSWAMTKGNIWKLFFFGILTVLINILGVILILVGLFITVPTTLLATTFVYRKLLNASK